MLLCAVAEPSSEAFVQSAQLALAALQYASRQLAGGDGGDEKERVEEKAADAKVDAEEAGGPGVRGGGCTQGRAASGQWGVERSLLAYRRRHDDVDGAVTILEQMAKVSFAQDFAAALSAVVLRGLPFAAARPVFATWPGDATRSTRGGESRVSARQGNARASSLLALVPAAPATTPPRAASLALLDFCAAGSLRAWAAAADARKLAAATGAAAAATASAAGAAAPGSALPAYVVVLASVRGLAWAEELIEGHLAALVLARSSRETGGAGGSRGQRRSSGAPFTFRRSTIDNDEEFEEEEEADGMYAGAGAAGATGNGGANGEEEEDEENDDEEEEEEEEEEEDWSFFALRHFPDLRSQALALALLFAAFFQGDVAALGPQGSPLAPRTGRADDLALLEALRVGCEALPLAFAALRPHALPRLQARLLGRDAMQHSRAAANLPPRAAPGLRVGRGGAVASLGDGTALLAAVGALLAVAFEADDAAAAAQAKTAAAAQATGVTNLDAAGELSFVQEAPSGDHGGDDGDGVGPWGGGGDSGSGSNGKGKGNGGAGDRGQEQRQGQKAQRGRVANASVLAECGFGHLLRLRGPGQGARNGDPDDSDSTGDEGDAHSGDESSGDRGSTGGDSGLRGGGPGAAMMGRPAREQVCLLAAELLGAAAETGRKRLAASAHVAAELEAEAAAAVAATAADAAALAAEAALASRISNPGVATATSPDAVGRSRSSSDADRLRQRGPASRPSASGFKRPSSGVTSPVTSLELPPSPLSADIAAGGRLARQFSSSAVGAAAARRSGGTTRESCAGIGSGAGSGSAGAAAAGAAASSPRAGRRSGTGAPLSVRTRGSPADKSAPGSPRLARPSTHADPQGRS
jgi:hypothetical protein